MRDCGVKGINIPQMDPHTTMESEKGAFVSIDLSGIWVCIEMSVNFYSPCSSLLMVGWCWHAIFLVKENIIRTTKETTKRTNKRKTTKLGLTQRTPYS